MIGCIINDIQLLNNYPESLPTFIPPKTKISTEREKIC